MLRPAPLLLAALSIAGCTPRGEALPTPAGVPAPTGAFRSPPADRPAPRVDFASLAPEELVHIPRWDEASFGAAMPATTYRPGDQAGAPLRWDRAGGREAEPGAGLTYVGYHGHGCCGACQAVAMLGAVRAVERIAAGAPVPRRRALPHRPEMPPLENELELAILLGVSRQAFIGGGRDVPELAPALAIVGAPTRAAVRPLLPRGRGEWLPARLCRALAGKRIPVLRARMREHDVRFMTVALRDGPVVISGAFNKLRRDEDDVYRCPEDPTGASRHHFALVIGWETNDRDHDGEPDEVLWIVRDDHERRGGELDTWEDGFLYDEWARIVPRGCLLDGGRAHSVVPGTVSAGTFDDPVLPGSSGALSYCEADPDGDGVPTIRDTCPFWPDPEQLDRDGDELGDPCDPCPDAAPVDATWPGHLDSDGDSVADACDPCPQDPDPACAAGAR